MLGTVGHEIATVSKRGAVILLGAVGLTAEAAANPGKWLAGMERKGERSAGEIGSRLTKARRRVGTLKSRAAETSSGARGVAQAASGIISAVAQDGGPPSRKPAKRPATRRKPAVTRVGTSPRPAPISATRRSEAAQKGSRTRALNERRAEAKKAQSVAKAQATRAAKESKAALADAAAGARQGIKAASKTLSGVAAGVGNAVS